MDKVIVRLSLSPLLSLWGKLSAAFQYLLYSSFVLFWPMLNLLCFHSLSSLLFLSTSSPSLFFFLSHCLIGWFIQSSFATSLLSFHFKLLKPIQASIPLSSFIGPFKVFGQRGFQSCSKCEAVQKSTPTDFFRTIFFNSIQFFRQKKFWARFSWKKKLNEISFLPLSFILN